MRSKKSAPNIVTRLELNQKFGHGYQVRIIMEGILDSVMDDEPLTLDEAYSGAVYAIEEINKETGYGYDPYKIIVVSGEALEGNKHHDFTTARVARDVEQGYGELSTPIPAIPDCTTKFINGEEELAFSGRGTVLTTFFLWRDDKLPKAYESLQRYCEYLAMYGYGAGASEILAELDQMDKDRGANWIKATYGKYVKDAAALIRYIMPQL